MTLCMSNDKRMNLVQSDLITIVEQGFLHTTKLKSQIDSKSYGLFTAHL